MLEELEEEVKDELELEAATTTEELDEVAKDELEAVTGELEGATGVELEVPLGDGELEELGSTAPDEEL